MDRDRRLAEMMGMDYPQRKLHNPDFSTPEWRAKLMDWAVEQEWWDEFKDWSLDKAPDDDNDWVAYLWRNLPDLIVEYHGEGRK